MSYFDRVEEAAVFVRARLGDIPPIAVVLGSGLGAFADRLDGATRVPYTEIPHWPASTVIGHAGTLVCGATAGHGVLTLAGRAHFYEGHDLRTVTFATRVLARLGVKTLVLTHLLAQIDRPGVRERIVHEIQQEFTGEVIWGEDLMRLTLAGSGIAAIEEAARPDGTG